MNSRFFEDDLMKTRVLPFVDHEIGFQLLKKMLDTAPTNFDIVAVVTTKENGLKWWPGVETICLDAGIPMLRYPCCGVEAIEQISPDLFLFLSWKYVMPEHLLGLASLGAINLHYSLLPKYRGVYPVNWALIDGCDETGITYHFVNSCVDGGDIVIQRKLPINADDTSRTLQKRLDLEALEAFDALLDLIKKEELHTSPSKQHDIELHKYRSRRDFEEICRLDLDKKYTLREVVDLLRGLSFLPMSGNAYFEDQRTGKKIYLHLALTAETFCDEAS